MLAAAVFTQVVPQSCARKPTPRMPLAPLPTPIGAPVLLHATGTVA
jgi:hypothetical protein